jgi:hypothetical protein
MYVLRRRHRKYLLYVLLFSSAIACGLLVELVARLLPLLAFFPP